MYMLLIHLLPASPINNLTDYIVSWSLTSHESRNAFSIRRPKNGEHHRTIEHRASQKLPRDDDRLDYWRRFVGAPFTAEWVLSCTLTSYHGSHRSNHRDFLQNIVGYLGAVFCSGFSPYYR